MDKTKTIRREAYATGLHLRENADGTLSRVITGRAIVFNTPSVPLYEYDGEQGVEVISPEAVTRELLDASDIKMTMFHDRQLLLARSNQGKGTLTYNVDKDGVTFEFEAPATADGDKAVELVKRGDIAGCSFAFRCKYYDDDAVTVTAKTQDNMVVKTYTVRRIAEIVDFTLASDPAYPTTDCSLRREVSAAETPGNSAARLARAADLRRLATQSANY